MSDLPNPHDALFRAVFEILRLAIAFLRDHLPNSVAGHLVLEDLERAEGSFIDETLVGSQSDALFRAPVRGGGSAFVYLLLEHKSWPDPALPLQLAGYMLRIWRRHVREAGSGALRALPPIVPVVLYAGSRRWTVAEGLGQMVAGPPDLAFLPGASYILRNVGEIPAEALSGDAALRAVLVTMRREAMEHLAELSEALPGTGDLLRQVIGYILRVYDGVDLEGLTEALRRDGATEMEAAVGTIAETLLERGEMRGLVRGKAEGKAEALGRLLERRFGPLPKVLPDRIAAADLGRIEAWFDAAVDAPDLASVFGPDFAAGA